MTTEQSRPKGKQVIPSRIKVRFIIRKSRTNKVGVCPIDCRVRINGVQATPFSTHIMVKPENWDSKVQAISGNEGDTAKLTSMREGLEAVYQEFRIRGRRPAPHEVIAHYFDHELEYDKLWSIQDLAEMQLKELKRRGRSQPTLIKYKRVYSLFQEFTKIKLVQDVRKAHIKSFWNWLKSKDYSNDYCNKMVQALFGLFELALSEEIIPHNPAKGIHYDRENKLDLTCLTEDELDKLKTTEWSPKLQGVVDSFLFMCYTGLHITDYIQLSDENIKSSLKVKWIEYDRQKNGQPAIIPLHPVASALIRKYGSIRLLPKISPQKQNEYLKVVAEYLKTDKLLTNKVARKTFTDMSINQRGMSFESVAAMLGHASTKFVRVYGKVKQHRVLSEWKA